MRVYVEEDMTVCPDGHVLSLRAGETVEGPLARYLAASGCNVTVEEDDRPPATLEAAPAAEESHTPGGGHQVGTEVTAEPEPDSAPAAAEPE